MLAQALVAFPNGQAALLFDGATRHGPRDRTIITGSAGTLESIGPDLGQQQVTYTNAAGFSRPPLTGTWFNDGFVGAMGALLERDRNRQRRRSTTPATTCRASRWPLPRSLRRIAACRSSRAASARWPRRLHLARDRPIELTGAVHQARRNLWPTLDTGACTCRTGRSRARPARPRWPRGSRGSSRCRGRERAAA